MRGEVLATIHDRRVRLLIGCAGLTLVLLAGGATVEGVYLLTAVFGIPGLVLAAFALGHGSRLVLTTEGIFRLARPRMFGPEVVLASIPLAELATVRHWTENRKSSGSNSHTTFHIIQVRDAKGKGFRVTEQLMPKSQLESMRHALESRGIALELRDGPAP